MGFCVPERRDCRRGCVPLSSTVERWNNFQGTVSLVTEGSGGSFFIGFPLWRSKWLQTQTGGWKHPPGSPALRMYIHSLLLQFPLPSQTQAAGRQALQLPHRASLFCQRSHEVTECGGLCGCLCVKVHWNIGSLLGSNIRIPSTAFLLKSFSVFIRHESTDEYVLVWWQLSWC